MNYKEWIKQLPKSLKINWSEPLTEEEKKKISRQLPDISEFWIQEQKELRMMKKMADKYERQASAKDSEISKERLRMRLRKKLESNKEAKAKGKVGHVCTKECERRRKKRAMKLAAKKNIDVPKSKDNQLSEEQQQNLEEEKVDLYQYRDPEYDTSNDDDEKEDDGESQNDADEEDNNNDDDDDEFDADVQNYPSPYKSSYLSKKHKQNNKKKEKKMDQIGNAYEKYFNSDSPSHVFDNDLSHDTEKDVKGDKYSEDEVQGLQMKSLVMSEGPQQTHGRVEDVLNGEEDNASFLPQPQENASSSSNFTRLKLSNDISKFLNYKYHF